MPRPKKTPKPHPGNATQNVPATGAIDTAPTQPKLPDNKFPVVVKNKGGRPSDYNIYTTSQICARITNGESVRSICRDDDMPSLPTLFLWLQVHPEFSNHYTQAMQNRVETHVEEIFDIADDTSNDTIEDGETGNLRANSEWIARSRLRVDVRKWAASKMKPKKYGDRMIQEVTGANGGPIQTATLTINAADLDPDARDALRSALLLSRKEGE